MFQKLKQLFSVSVPISQAAPLIVAPKKPTKTRKARVMGEYVQVSLAPLVRTGWDSEKLVRDCLLNKYVKLNHKWKYPYRSERVGEVVNHLAGQSLVAVQTGEVVEFGPYWAPYLRDLAWYKENQFTPTKRRSEKAEKAIKPKALSDKAKIENFLNGPNAANANNLLAGFAVDVIQSGSLSNSELLKIPGVRTILLKAEVWSEEVLSKKITNPDESASSNFTDEEPDFTDDETLGSGNLEIAKKYAPWIPDRRQTDKPLEAVLS